MSWNDYASSSKIPSHLRGRIVIAKGNRTRAFPIANSLMHGDKLAIALEWFHNYEHGNKSKNERCTRGRDRSCIAHF